MTPALHKAVAPDRQQEFGSRTVLLLIAAAVFLGTIEGRPLTASKLAAYVGMPRPTVIRRLRILSRGGSVERVGTAYRTPQKRLAQLARSEHAGLIKLVRTTSGRLR